MPNAFEKPYASGDSVSERSPGEGPTAAEQQTTARLVSVMVSTHKGTIHCFTAE